MLAWKEDIVTKLKFNEIKMTLYFDVIKIRRIRFLSKMDEDSGKNVLWKNIFRKDDLNENLGRNQALMKYPFSLCMGINLKLFFSKSLCYWKDSWFHFYFDRMVRTHGVWNRLAFSRIRRTAKDTFPAGEDEDFRFPVGQISFSILPLSHAKEVWTVLVSS